MAQSRAKSMTNNLPLLSVLAVRYVLSLIITMLTIIIIIKGMETETKFLNQFNLEATLLPINKSIQVQMKAIKMRIPENI